jgi:hypothetical protein
MIVTRVRYRDALQGKRPNMRIVTVDLISNTCFPLLAADELGLFKAEGLDVSIELLPTGVQALRSGGTAFHAS